MPYLCRNAANCFVHTLVGMLLYPNQFNNNLDNKEPSCQHDFVYDQSKMKSSSIQIHHKQKKMHLFILGKVGILTNNIFYVFDISKYFGSI